MEIKGTDLRQELRKEARASVRGRLPRMERAALVGAAHKLNYALLSCKSISVVIARGHILDTFSQGDNPAACIVAVTPCTKSLSLLFITFVFEIPNVFVMSTSICGILWCVRDQ